MSPLFNMDSANRIHIKKYVSISYLGLRKCGEANINEPMPIINSPPAMNLGFEAPTLPPKYVTGITLKKDPMS